MRWVYAHHLSRFGRMDRRRAQFASPGSIAMAATHPQGPKDPLPILILRAVYDLIKSKLSEKE